MANEPSTTDLIQLQELRDGVLILKDGSLRAVVKVSAINFELRSSDEQQALLQQFSGFLNSIDFPIQMVVHSRRYDISKYIASVQAAAEQLSSELLKTQASEYARFVSELADLANIMEKNFYIVLPLTVITPTENKGILGGLKDIFKKAPSVQTIPAEQLATYRMQLQQRADLIIGSLSGMGLKGEMLGQDALVELFNGVYNPAVPASRSQSK